MNWWLLAFQESGQSYILGLDGDWPVHGNGSSKRQKQQGQ